MNYVIMTFSNTYIVINQKQYETFWELSATNAQGMNINGEYLAFSNVAHTPSEERFYEMFPDKKPTKNTIKLDAPTGGQTEREYVLNAVFKICPEKNTYLTPTIDDITRLYDVYKVRGSKTLYFLGLEGDKGVVADKTFVVDGETFKIPFSALVLAEIEKAIAKYNYNPHSTAYKGLIGTIDATANTNNIEYLKSLRKGFVKGIGGVPSTQSLNLLKYINSKILSYPQK